MKIIRKILTIAGVILIYACGSSKQAIVKPTVVIDSKPAVADTITPGLEVETDTTDNYTDDSDSDSVSADSSYSDSIPFVNATESWKDGIKDGIDNILDNSLLRTSVCGVEVWDLDDDISLYRHDELQRLRPASTMKTITAVTALNELGSDYKFSTKIYYDGSEPDSAHVWRGDLYIVGGMDPKITDGDIIRMAKDIRQLGVDSIMGYIYSDQSFKDNRKFASGWCWDDKHNPLLMPLKFNGKDTFVDVLINELRRKGVYVDGIRGERTHPAGARLVAECQRPMRSVMRPMLKNSNNEYAESVFYAMIHNANGNGASAHQGQTMIRNLMSRAGVDNAASYDFVDGSGLSLYDYVSPHAEVMMLRYAWQHKDIYDFFRPLLPVAGRDGTLRKRMRGTRAAGNVHAKTGTVTGIRSLCGYVTASNGHHIAFSIINQGVNGDDGTAQRAKNLQDRICELLAQ